MKILVLCTRDPGGRNSGRKVVLKTIVSCLVRLGHSVEVAVLAPGPLGALDRDFPPVSIHHIKPPAWPPVVVNVLRSFIWGRLSLNECLFFSRRAQRELHALVRSGSYELIVGDMIRSVPLIADLGTPYVVDLDDRLSERYLEIASGGNDYRNLLGYSAPRFPRALRIPVTWIIGRLLRRESAILRRREVQVAKLAAAVSLVGAEEAHRLEAEAEVQVFALPMAVDVGAPGANVESNPEASMVFTGGLDYHANAEAIRWFASEVLPRLRELVPAFSLTVVGFCPEDLRTELEQPGLIFLGYVEDLRAELSRHRGFLAPLLSGQGIKTKVLEAMAVGLPVVSTQPGLTGLAVKHMESCFVADSPIAFAGWAAHLVQAPRHAAEVGEAGREYVRASFSLEALTRRWRELLESTSRQHGPT